MNDTQKRLIIQAFSITFMAGVLAIVWTPPTLVAPVIAVAGAVGFIVSYRAWGARAFGRWDSGNTRVGAAKELTSLKRRYFVLAAVAIASLIGAWSTVRFSDLWLADSRRLFAAGFTAAFLLAILLQHLTTRRRNKILAGE